MRVQAAHRDKSPRQSCRRNKVLTTKRQSKWDKLPDVTEAISQQKTVCAVITKRRRECYFGNLTAGKVTDHVLRQAVNRLFNELPSFRMMYPDVQDVVRSITFPSAGGGMFAFVDLVDEVVASTAVQMNGFELCGRSVRVGRPQGYLAPETGDVPPLDVSHLRSLALLANNQNMSSGPKMVVTNTLRELHFGNLASGTVDEESIRELLTPACLELPEYDESQGPPVTKVTMCGNGTYCFVQFQNAEMASRVIAVFDDTELCGRRLKVNRPSQYIVSLQQVQQVDPFSSQSFSEAQAELEAAAISHDADVTSEAFSAGALAALNFMS